MFTVYPVTETDISTSDYIVKINGELIPLNTARVSAYPFNRRWPGKQRSIGQTELVNFLSLETDEPLNFEIIPKTPFERLDIRPKELGITPVITQDGKISFTLSKPAYFTVEPYGRSHALHIFADPHTDYETEKSQSDVIYFGSGEHNVGMLELKSNQTVFIDEGAVVYTCIKAVDCENINIVGRGILDNSRNKEKILFEAYEDDNDTAINNEERIHTIQLEYCTNVKIEGITIRDSLVYNIRPIGCKNLDIENVKIIGCWRYNSDGIDMHNCENVTINNCFIRTFDDCICVKGFDNYYDGDIEDAVRNAMYRNGKSYDVFKNVRVKKCVLWNDWGKCLEIGAETRAEEITDIVFEDCKIIHVTGTPLDCLNVDYADINNVTYRNISIEYDDVIPRPTLQKSDSHKYENSDTEFYPAVIGVTVLFHHEYSAGGLRRGKNRNITFENIRYYGKHTPLFAFEGHNNDAGVTDITIKNFFMNNKKINGKEYDIRVNRFCKNIIIE